MEIITEIPMELLTDPVSGQLSQAELMAYPENAQDVSDLLKKAGKNKRKVISMGSATGLVSGLSSKKDNYILNLSKMNKIISLDEETLTLTVEAGTKLGEIRDYLSHTNYFYAPDPGSKEATIGGNAATNAGGMRALKYGVSRDNIRGMEVVLSDGRIIELGGLNNKSSSGYNLINLFIGSEGTLGVITKLQLKIRPKALFEGHLLVGFSKLNDLAPVIYKILSSQIRPTALEFVDRKSFNLSQRVIEVNLAEIEGDYFLLLTVDGSRQQDVSQELEELARLASENGAIQTRILSEQEALETWLLRDSIMLGGRDISVLEPYDLVVPINQITQTVLELEELALKLNVQAYFFGHAGDGNIHMIVLKADLTEAEWNEQLAAFNPEVYQIIKKNGGLPAAEHGIGTMKKDILLDNLGSDIISLMKDIKKTIDPMNILNPGKIFD